MSSASGGGQTARVGSGLLCLLVGGVWIAQGTGHLSGSFMTGETRWTVIGSVVVVVGIALELWALTVVRRDRARRPPAGDGPG